MYRYRPRYIGVCIRNIYIYTYANRDMYGDLGNYRDLEGDSGST